MITTMTARNRFDSKNRATWVVAEFLDIDAHDASWHMRALRCWTDAIESGSDVALSQAVFRLALEIEEEYRTNSPVADGDRYEELLESALIEVAWKDIAARLIDDALAFRAVRPSKPILPAPIQRVTVPTGNLHCSPRVRALVCIHLVRQMLDRHTLGDWGNCCAEEWQANNCALLNGAKLVSKYRTREGLAFWLVTEADRSVTAAILPDEY